MKWAIIFKFMEQSSVVAFPLILKAYLRQLTTDPGNFNRAIFFSGMATILNFSRTMLSQHSSKRVGACKTLTGQILRTLFFQKLNRANYVFSFIADTSLIAKMNFFDIDAFINFIGVVPNLFAAPFALTFAIVFIAISLDIGWYVWIMIGVFFIAAILILIFNYIIIIKRKDMNFTSSMRN
jgi:ABC-type transport system involved in cytochrome bd biosynthesis fused ATPase/permease subunit